MTFNKEQKEFIINLLMTSADLLNEVRTGEDFEVVCYDQATKLESYVKDLEKIGTI